MDPDWRRLADHARGHHGTISTAEAAALGIDQYRLANWVRSGRLSCHAPQLYVVAGTPGTWHQRVRTATGSGAAWASHRTAAALAGLDGFPPEHIEVVTVRGRRRKRTAWTVHESRTLRGVDLDAVDGIPTTSLVRTVLDLPAVVHPYLVAKALDHACRGTSGLLDLVVQRHLELSRRGRPGARLMGAMLDERLGTGRFTESAFEDLALRLVREIGLPEPVLQHPVRDGDFVAYLDLAWPDIRWLIECDSLAHHSGKGPHEWDRARRRHLKRLGWDTVEITYDDVTQRRGRTGRELRELYEARRASLSGVSHASHERAGTPETLGITRRPPPRRQSPPTVRPTP